MNHIGKITSSILIVLILLSIQLGIEFGYIQYGIGDIHYEAPPRIWLWDEITQSKGEELIGECNK